jgi:hypothetical protein
MESKNYLVEKYTTPNNYYGNIKEMKGKGKKYQNDLNISEKSKESESDDSEMSEDYNFEENKTREIKCLIKL